MSEKKESVSLTALFKKMEENAQHKNPSTEQNITSSNHTTEDEPEVNEDIEAATNPTVSSKENFANSIARMKALKPGHKTKMEVDTDTNKKVILLSKTLGVNGYAVIGIAVNEFLEKYKKEIDRAMKNTLR